MSCLEKMAFPAMKNLSINCAKGKSFLLGKKPGRHCIYCIPTIPSQKLAPVQIRKSGNPPRIGLIKIGSLKS